MNRLNKLFKRVTPVIMVAAVFSVRASDVDPTATRYTVVQCEGSAMPYQEPHQHYAYPDTLHPVFLNHVGRHGARYPSSSKNTDRIISILSAADSEGGLTDKGHRILQIAKTVKNVAEGRWGSLDSLGMAEQRGIASRMYSNYPELFEDNSINAVSSYAPRCIMSMYSFLHQLTRLDNRIEVSASSGRRYSGLLRFFDMNQDYRDYVDKGEWREELDRYMTTVIPADESLNFVRSEYHLSEADRRDLTYSIYSLLAGMQAMQMKCELADFFSSAQLNRLWSCANLRHYLMYSTNTLSSAVSEAAVPLLLDLISTTDDAIESIEHDILYSTVQLRFGHAETLMPLLSLMHLNGCFYLTNYFDTVGLHWKDFDIVPMAANLQMILFRSGKGKYYVRIEINEIPVALMPGSEETILPWEKVKSYFQHCIPIYLQN